MAEKKKTVLITGAAGGVGRATVAYFSARGFQVIGVDRSPYYENFPEMGFISRLTFPFLKIWK
jgi:nucleoside-diphosphate-sugar epimerase